MKCLLQWISLMILSSVGWSQGVDSAMAISVSPFITSKASIAAIHFSGNKRTKSSVMLREMNVRAGQEIEIDSLSNCIRVNEDRLYSTSLFTDVDIDIDTISAHSIVLQVRVKERWYIIPEFSFDVVDRNFNVWWTEKNHDIRRSIIGVTLKHQNLLGNREQLGVTAQIGYRQEFGVNYIVPYLDKNKKHGLGVEAEISESKEIFYATDSNKLKQIRIIGMPMLRQANVSVAYYYRPQYATTHVLQATYYRAAIADTVYQLNPNYYSNGSKEMRYAALNYRISVNRVDNWNYPLQGSKIIGNAFSLVGFKGMDFNTYFTLEAGQFNRIAQSPWYTSVIFRGKLSFPAQQPYALQQGMGTKYEYVRGYEMYVVDGYHFGLLRTNLKYELLHYTIKKIPLKYLPTLPLRVYPKIIADAGYVYHPQPGNSFLSNRLLYSAGVGLDFFTAYDFKIRIEYVINHLGQKGLFLHIHSE